jgi:diphthine synthase
LTCGPEALEEFYDRKIIVADRDLVELGADQILEGADELDVALLVGGDPFSATTHTDLVLRAKEKGLQVEIVHNASILNAVGCCGLQLYNFGETISIPYWTDVWQPDSFFDKIIKNYKNKLHTLCLLDIKVKEPTYESLTKKKKEYMPPRFMTVSEASQQLVKILQNRAYQNDEYVTENSLCVGLARVGTKTQQIVACTLQEMCKADLGGPLHSLVVTGPVVHPLELEYLKQFMSGSDFNASFD